MEDKLNKTENKLIEKINEAIGDLVYEKIQLRKTYNYYHCTRDAEQFRHIEDNYGIGTPTALGFTPLIKKHIDVLVGEYLELDPELHVSCKDEKTINHIMQDKKLEIDSKLYQHLSSKLFKSIMNVFFNNKESTPDPFIEKELLKIKEDIDKSYVSDYEIAAQNILTYLRQSRNIDLKNKMRELFTDLLITGTCYYRARPTHSKENVNFEVLDPLNTFIERNRNHYFLNKSSRCVIRKWMTKDQILHDYASELDQEAIEQLEQEVANGDRNFNSVYIRTQRTLEVPDGDGNIMTRQIPTAGLLGGLEVTPIYPYDGKGQYNYLNTVLIPVYEVELIESDKKGRLKRIEGVKIGRDIYIPRGENKDLIGTKDDPTGCTISVNGLFFLDKNGFPFSLVDKTMNLQDKYDILNFYKDNLIATSGTVGDWIDLAHIPSVLGVSFPERVEKWLAYKKNGVALFDSSQEGAEMLNTTFQGYDDTVKHQSIQAIQLAIDSVELQAAAITGVFPEKLGGVEARDAVSNVKVGIKYSTLLTKQYFYGMDQIYKEVNYDLLNLAKVVYSKGITGTILLGDKYNKIFTALPKHYTVTDFDIHIEDSVVTFQDRELIKQYSVELVKANQADPEMFINLVLSKNVTEMKRYIENNLKAKRAENDQLEQAQEQIEEYEQNRKQLEQQLEELSRQNQQLMNEIERNNQEKLEIERKGLELEEQKIRNQKDYNDKVIITKEKQIQAEIMQFYDDSPYNDKVKKVI